MKMVTVFRKSLLEQRRDLLLLGLSLSLAPFMVLLYWLFYGGSGSTSYDILVLNNDQSITLADGSTFDGGAELVEAIRGITHTDGASLLNVQVLDDRAAAEAKLRERAAEVLLIVPADFSSTLHATQQSEDIEPATVTVVGDLTNPLYIVAAVMADAAMKGYIEYAAGIISPVYVEEIALGGSATRTEFETYVPGLLVFAVIILVFQIALTVTREAETGTLRRLQLTHMSALDLLGGMSGVVFIVGAAAIILTYLTAVALGFHSQGSIWAAVLISTVSSLSVIGAGLIVAAFSKTTTQASLMATFPLSIFMFFSGAVLPLPPVHLFTIAGRAISLYDILPPTHAVNALNKILTLGMGVGDVLYEIVALLVLSALYFAAGVWFFRHSHMRAT